MFRTCKYCCTLLCIRYDSLRIIFTLWSDFWTGNGRQVSRNFSSWSHCSPLQQADCTDSPERNTCVRTQQLLAKILFILYCITTKMAHDFKSHKTRRRIIYLAPGTSGWSCMLVSRHTSVVMKGRLSYLKTLKRIDLPYCSNTLDWSTKLVCKF